MAKFDIASNVTYVDRAGWGSDRSIPRLGRIVPRTQRTKAIIHHTVIVDSDATKNFWETEAEVIQKMRELQRARPDLGRDVPYNFVIFLMNTNPASIYACEGRGEDRSGAHTIGHNTAGIGIALQGDFENNPTDPTPYVPLISLFLGWLKFDPNGPGYGGPYDPLRSLGTDRPSNRQVWCHRDLDDTACPGDRVVAILSQLEFRDPRRP